MRLDLYHSLYYHQTDDLSDYEDANGWNSLCDNLDPAIVDKTIMLNKYELLQDDYAELVDGIIHGTAKSIVSAGYFNPNSSVGPHWTYWYLRYDSPPFL